MDEVSSGKRSYREVFKKYCPNLVVYLPKLVTVQNPKLGLLNACNSLLVLLFTFYYFWTNNNYIIRKSPDTLISLCGFRCLPSAQEADIRASSAASQAYCIEPTTTIFNYSGHLYSNIQCATRCGSGQGGTGSCINTDDMMQTGPEEAFFPTFYQETYLASSSGGPCPTGLTATGTGTGRRCEKTGNYYVAGANDNRLVFNHEFLVTPHNTVVNMFMKSVDKKSHSGSFHSKGWEEGLVTRLFSWNGVEQGRYEQSEAANVTINDLLRAATYKDGQTQHLDFDTRYTQPETGVVNQAPLRLTGAHLSVDLYTTDTGKCPVFDIYRKEMRTIDVEAGRPTTCLTVHAERRWTMKEEVNPVGTGGLRTRRIHGIKITFRTMGNFEFSDDKAIFRNITVFFVWIRVPLWLTTTFCLLFLGKLSHIYGRVLTQELNLKNACKGLMARLMHHSAAFMDLADNDKGISKARIYDRFKDFLLDNEDIDDDELNRFVEFVFDGLKGTGHHPESDKDYVSLQEFCEVCSNNEPLNFQALVQLFDKDRKLGILEGFFLDPSLRASGGEAAEAGAPAEPEQIDYTKVKDEQGPTHSRVQTAAMEVENMLQSLKGMEKSAVRAAGDLEIDDDTLGLKDGSQNDNGQEAKLDQRESFCSIMDEEDECGGGKEPSKYDGAEG